MNNQQLFDRVVTHLRKQGKPARTDSKVCRYRTEDGLSCAVGCLITDEVYAHGGIESFSVNTDQVRKAVELSIGHELDADAIDLLTKLQYAHDYIMGDTFTLGIESEFKHIAKLFKLSYTAPEITA